MVNDLPDLTSLLGNSSDSRHDGSRDISFDASGNMTLPSYSQTYPLTYTPFFETAAEYNEFLNQLTFGTNSSATSDGSTNGVVPEPRTGLMLLLVSAGLVQMRCIRALSRA